MFSHPKSRSNIVNLLTTELLYSYILNTNRGSLRTRSFRGIHLFVLKYRLIKMDFRARKDSGAFEKRPLVCTGFACFYDGDVTPTISAILMIPE